MATGTDPVPTEVDVAIVGAGIGGLAAAVALARAGVDVHVFERTQVVREVGGAVVIRAPSVDLMDGWGLGEGFRAAAVAVDTIDWWDGEGRPTGSVPADFLGDGQPWSVHRADLQSLLLSAVPDGRVHLGHAAVGARTEGDRAVVDLSSGHSVSAPLLIGADGIRSVLRPAVVRDEATFARLVVLRSVSPASALPAGVTNDRLNMWVQGERMLLALPLRAGAQAALDFIVRADEPPAELWNPDVPTSRMVEGFAGFFPGLIALIEAGGDTLLSSPVYERAPIATWSAGRITLLGDAAHPMAPRQGQGANQAIQDAGALAGAVGRIGLQDVPALLADYEAQRVEVAGRIQLLSQRAPDFVAARATG